MRIHTKLTLADVREAIEETPGAYAATLSEHRSRSHPRAFEVKLEGNSRRRPNGGSATGYAATWDQWGVFLANIYRLDARAKCWAYNSRDQFDRRTSRRFATPGMPDDAHGDHTFRYAGVPYTQACTKCSAVVKWERA